MRRRTRLICNCAFTSGLTWDPASHSYHSSLSSHTGCSDLGSYVSKHITEKTFHLG